MLGAAGNLVLMPEYRAFVMISIAAYIALFWLIETRIRSQRTRRFVEVAVTSIFIVFTMIWSAYNYNPPLFIARGMSFQHVSHDVEIQLFDVQSIRGWGEGEPVARPGHDELLHGDHELNKALPNPRWVFDRVFDRMGIPHRDDVLDMDQMGWAAFLRGLDPVQQRQIGKIPFATFDLRTGDGRVRRLTMFRNDSLTVRDGSGAVMGRLCMDNIFNVPDVVSGEREAIVVSFGAAGCG